MKDYVRTFMGCRVVPDEKLNAVLDSFESCHPEFRPVAASNLHVTICFLGELHVDAAEEFANCLTDHLTDASSFEATLGTPGGFPSADRASIAWLSVAPGRAFAKLNSKCVEVAALLGINTEDRPYHAHLTIGRLPRPRRSSRRRRTTYTRADLSDFAALHSADPITVQPIETVTVYSSQLAAGGSIYTPRREIDLR